MRPTMRPTIMLSTAAMIIAAAVAPVSDLRAEVKPGDYRLVVTTPLGELPINLKVEKKGSEWSAAYINGPEKMQAEVTRVGGDALTVEFPSYNARLEATVDGAGALAGKLVFNRASGAVEVPLAGQHGQAHRFFAAPEKTVANLGGRWAVSVPAPDGTSRPGIAEFTQTGEKIHGAVMYINADTRWLAGEVRGNELYMSVFDGGTGALWRGTLQADGTLAGESFSMVGFMRQAFTAKRDAQAALPDPTKLTYLKPGYDKFEFSFPERETGKPVTLADARFKDKVTIITIGGSWCPTCHDEMAYIAPYVRANRARGLEAVALMYEFSPDFAKASAACGNFAKRYGIDFPMLIAGTADKEAASKTLPMINAVLVYPTMIVVDRKGNVRQIHTSFPGPATGVHHENFKKDFERLIDGLLSEGV
ncbi:MAG: TlpA disulfide reductase family protein [Rhodospirillaceae bacterium]|nr:TlpA disulfide reductase family protein [Rhodospirillaceae bacterium]